MATPTAEQFSKLQDEFNTTVETIQFSDPRFKSLERIVEWGFAVSIGTILGVISNYDKFKINNPKINAYILISILFFIGITSALLLCYKILLYLYDRKVVTKAAQGKALGKLAERMATGNAIEYYPFLKEKAKEFFTDYALEKIEILALNPKREIWIMIFAALFYSLGFILYMGYFAYALLN